MIALLWMFCAYALIGIIVMGSTLIVAKKRGDKDLIDFFKEQYSGIKDGFFGFGLLILSWPHMWKSWYSWVVDEIKLQMWKRLDRK